MWVGPLHYVFHPGRDVIVGVGEESDIRLDRPGLVDQNTPPELIPDLVLRYSAAHWVAIDRSGRGLYVGRARVSTLDIADGQSITLSDPERGPRLSFQLGAPPGPSAQPTDPPRPVPLPAPEHPPTPAEAHPATAAPPAAPAEADPEPPAPQPVAPAEPPAPEPTTQHPPAEWETTPLPVPPEPPPAGPPEPASTELIEVPARPASEEVPPPPTHTGAGAIIDTGTDTSTGEPYPTTSRLPLQPGARTIGISAYQLGLTVNGHALLSDITFTARPGALIAVAGPSRARNSALLGLLGTTRPLTSGVLTVDGHDVHAEPEAMRFRVGVVSGDERVHRNLTVERALEYGAELRLPADTPPDHRRRVVDQLIDELGLAPHRETRVGKLPPELRRCASLAVELLTRPSLLVVDELTAGLDPVQENHVMSVLRRQADLGCVVVVATPSLAHVNMCDQVLLLTPAGTLAFAGPPTQLESAFGTVDWYQIFGRISADPQGTHQTFLNRQQASVWLTPPSVARPMRTPASPGFGQQLWLMIRRQARLLVAGHYFLLFLLLLTCALAALPLLVPGSSGFNRSDSSGPNPHQAIEMLAALNIAAVIAGTTLTIRDIVGERLIFRREQAVGLASSAYLLAKLIVFGAVAAIQAAILTTVIIVVKGGPAYGATLLGSADVELYAAVAATTVVSAIVGLALSSLGRSLREVLPLFVPVVLASVLFAGGILPLVGKWGLDQISWLIPARWGFAASAATVDVRRVDALAVHNETWTHYAGWWVFDMGILAVLGALWAGYLLYRLRPVTPASAQGRTHPSGTPQHDRPSDEGRNEQANQIGRGHGDRAEGQLP
ncbi:ABC transporter permease [Mycobacterium bourgelatii]|nr:ABC transporter permease [Mycobacterium bourgelatii]